MGASGRFIFQVLVSLRSPVLSLKHNPGMSWRSLALSVLNSVSPSDASSGIHKSRTHKCGHLSTRDIGKIVCLYGWVHRIRLSKFLILRDSFGYVQVRLDDAVKRPVFDSPFKTLSRESVVSVTGTVAARPPKDVNKELPTGEIEVLANEVNVINPLQSPLPFFPADHIQSNEQLRLAYRYLDLRSSFLQRNLKFRSDFVLKLRNYLCDTQGFIEVETPCLFRRTPGGAREFITPTSFSGLFYSLPQSPQQFKQLLMVGAVDRYMQVARCFRDEPSRSDRQPEFTQLDLEMAFANSDDVMNIIEEMLVAVWPLINVMRSDSTVPDLPLPRMSYQFAMAHYGSDKPDIRFDLRFCEPTRCGYVGFKVHGTDASKFTKSELKKLLDEVNRDTEDGVSFLEVASCPPHLHELLDALKPDSCDIILFVRGSEDKLLTALGNTRTNLARLLNAKGVPIYNPGLHFLWIYDFPLFRRNECGDWECVHHPFTAPTSETLHFVYCDPSRVVAQHYDLVCNGNEVGGGSIRIHDASLQQYILSTILKEDTRQMEYFITALKSGAPPHGGIALGLDRLIALILNTNSIRDVIAFPKAADGYDLMCGAPSKVPDEDLKHYRITLTK